MTADLHVVPAEGNPFKIAAQYRKARKIVNVLLAQGADLFAIESLGTLAVGRVLASEAAGVLEASQETWALVVEMAKEAREE